MELFFIRIINKFIIYFRVYNSYILVYPAVFIHYYLLVLTIIFKKFILKQYILSLDILRGVSLCDLYGRGI